MFGTVPHVPFVKYKRGQSVKVLNTIHVAGKKIEQGTVGVVKHQTLDSHRVLVNFNSLNKMSININLDSLELIDDAQNSRTPRS